MRSIFKSKAQIVIFLVLIAVVCVLQVGLNAYSSKLQYEINKINSEIQITSYKAANLEVKIQSATNVNNLEGRALEMGLIYPDFDRIITVKSAETKPTDFAAALKQNAYN